MMEKKPNVIEITEGDAGKLAELAILATPIEELDEDGLLKRLEHAERERMKVIGQKGEANRQFNEQLKELDGQLNLILIMLTAKREPMPLFDGQGAEKS